MKPIGLTFKHEGFGKVGEIMFIHHCLVCSKIHINRIARDDFEHDILGILDASLHMELDVRMRIDELGIYLLKNEDRSEVNIQLFGNLNF